MTIRTIDTLQRAFEKRIRLAEIAKAEAVPGGLIPQGQVGQAIDTGHSVGGYEANRDWVYACVRAIAQRIAGQSVRVGLAKTSSPVKTAMRLHDRKTYEKAAGQEIDLLDNHEVLDLLADPNPMMVSNNLMIATVSSLELTGRAHWWLPVVKGKRQLWYLPTGWVAPNHKDRWFNSWTLNVPGSYNPQPIPADEMVYFYYPDPKNPFESLSTLQGIYRSVSADESIQTAQAVAFKRGIFPGMAIIPGSVDDVYGGEPRRPLLEKHQRQQIMAAILEMYRGVMNYGEPIILDALIRDIKPITNKPTEMDFRDSGQLTKDRILQGFGVSPVIIGAPQDANRASAAVADTLFCDNTVNPKIGLLSQCMTGWMGPMFQPKGVRQRLVIHIEPARPNDPELLSRDYQFGYREGLVDEEEYRRDVLHLPPRKGRNRTRLSMLPAGVTAAISLSASVRSGQVTLESGRKMLEIFYGFTPAEARQVLDGKLSPPPEPVQPPPSQEPAGEGSEDTEGSGSDQAPEVNRKIAIPHHRSARGATRRKRKVKDWLRLTLRLHKQNEKPLVKSVRAYFRQQEKAILEAIKESGIAEIDKLSKAAEDYSAIVAQVYRPGDWDQLLIETVRPHLAKTAYVGAASELDAYESSQTKAPEDYGIDMEVPDGVITNVELFLNDAMGQPYWSDINQTTSDQLTAALARAIEEGGGLEQMMEGVRAVLGASGYRAETIARTETTGALNAGHYSARSELLQLGLVTEQQWLTIPDEFRRPAHAAMEGATVKGKDWFEVGGEKAPYPGWYGLSAAQRVRCRCFTITSETFAD